MEKTEPSIAAAISATVSMRTAQNRRQRWANISRHYDLGNDFFQLFLDETMAYSCAFFQSESESLLQAQKNKYKKSLKKPTFKSPIMYWKSAAVGADSR